MTVLRLLRLIMLCNGIPRQKNRPDFGIQNSELSDLSGAKTNMIWSLL